MRCLFIMLVTLFGVSCNDNDFPSRPFPPDGGDDDTVVDDDSGPDTDDDSGGDDTATPDERVDAA
ncbi:MAG TPA: hypothetical protein DEG44_01520, partial [Candidatus Kerfeldbacteria bacterium]|nr:hypothetical protein [Candidatus Kerfeldbacteria bacterium]